MTAAAADLVGVMQGALDDAVRYAGERTQFGVKIGSFQAVAHLLADALVGVEGARSCLWHAAWAIDHLPVDEARLAARTAKAYASAAGREVVETTVQVFGGIAISPGSTSRTFGCVARCWIEGCSATRRSTTRPSRRCGWRIGSSPSRGL